MTHDVLVALAVKLLRDGDPLPLDLETYLIGSGVDVSALREAVTANTGPFIG